jgi:hypothetical protein
VGDVARRDKRTRPVVASRSDKTGSLPGRPLSRCGPRCCENAAGPCPFTMTIPGAPVAGKWQSMGRRCCSGVRSHLTATARYRLPPKPWPRAARAVRLHEERDEPIHATTFSRITRVPPPSGIVDVRGKKYSHCVFQWRPTWHLQSIAALLVVRVHRLRHPVPRSRPGSLRPRTARPSAIGSSGVTGHPESSSFTAA